MLYDNAWGHPLNLAGKDYFIPILDNANFVLNALETLEGKNILSSLRGRSGRIRAFDNVEQIRKTGLRNFKIKEKEILDNIETAKAGIQEIWNKKTFEQRTNFTPDELALIAGIRKKLDSLRDELRSVRAATDTEIRRIDTIVKFVNIYSVPLLIIFGLSIFTIIRRRPTPRETNRREPVSRPLAWVALGSLALLFAGLLSVGYTAKTNSGEFLDRPVFPNLAQKINQVETIALSGHRQKLEFYKENGIWKLKGHNLPVLQDRIRSFLSAMLEAVYFEKKSGQAQYLSRFGLQPTDQPDAPGIWLRCKTPPAITSKTLKSDIMTLKSAEEPVPPTSALPDSSRYGKSPPTSSTCPSIPMTGLTALCGTSAWGVSSVSTIRTIPMPLPTWHVKCLTAKSSRFQPNNRQKSRLSPSAF